MPAGAIKCELLSLLLILGAVGENEVVCWWGWITPCDVHAGGCQMGEVELCDRPDPCKKERGDVTPTICRSQPPHCSQCLYMKFPTEVAKLQLWTLHGSETVQGLRGRTGRRKMVLFSALPANTLHPRPIWWVMGLSHYRWYVPSGLPNCVFFTQRCFEVP